MRPRISTLTFTFAAALASTGAIIACTSEASGEREPFAASDAGPDVLVNLPGPSTEDDSGVREAGPQRPPFNPADEAVVCTGDASACAVELVAGRNHFCARMNDGTVRCWGEDRFGAIGEAPDGGVAPPVRTIQPLANVTQISAGGATTCARIDDGTVRCWGSNTTGQLALSDDSANPSSDALDHPVPTAVSVKGSITRVDVGPRVVCAVLDSGKVYCWGDNSQQQIAQRTSSVNVPAELDLGTFALTRTTMGSATTFGLTPDGQVTSWGGVNGRQGFLGGRLSSVSPDARLSLVESLHDVTSFAASVTLEREEEGRLGVLIPPPPPPGVSLPHGHACVIAAGEVYCWGRSDFGALCTGLFDTERLPAHAPITGENWPQQLAVGDELTCARMTNGSIECCGTDHRGRFPYGFSPLFVPVDAFKGHAVKIATSHRAICALLQGGSVQCWGSNQYGELGQGPPDQDTHPTPTTVGLSQ